MIYLDLFLTFLQIGAVSFGGGYGMISLIREKVLLHGWLDERELLDMIAVSESTPGPIAVNTATFIGARQGGLFGAFCATLGVVLPSFVVLLLIAAVMRNFLKYRSVQAFLEGVRPCVIALILATAAILCLQALFGFSTAGDPVSPDGRGIVLFFLLALFSALFRRIRKKAVSPILLILVSAGLGMIFYAIG